MQCQDLVSTITTCTNLTRDIARLIQSYRGIVLYHSYNIMDLHKSIEQFARQHSYKGISLIGNSDFNTPTFVVAFNMSPRHVVLFVCTTTVVEKHHCQLNSHHEGAEILMDSMILCHRHIIFQMVHRQKNVSSIQSFCLQAGMCDVCQDQSIWCLYQGPSRVYCMATSADCSKLWIVDSSGHTHKMVCLQMASPHGEWYFPTEIHSWQFHHHAGEWWTRLKNMSVIEVDQYGRPSETTLVRFWCDNGRITTVLINSNREIQYVAWSRVDAAVRTARFVACSQTELLLCCSKRGDVNNHSDMIMLNSVSLKRKGRFLGAVPRQHMMYFSGFECLLYFNLLPSPPAQRPHRVRKHSSRARFQYKPKPVVSSSAHTTPVATKRSIRRPLHSSRSLDSSPEWNMAMEKLSIPMEIKDKEYTAERRKPLRLGDNKSNRLNSPLHRAVLRLRTP